MFIFRCEFYRTWPDNVPAPPPDYFVTCAEYYEVIGRTESQAGIGCTNPINKMPSVESYAQREIRLLLPSENGSPRNLKESLFVGLCAPYSVVYVMNDKGKTIDTIR